MRELVVDNGAEFHSDSLEAACWSLGIEIHYAPRKTGWFKAKIERFLGSMNRGIAHGTPGTTFSNIFEKDEYDPSKHAVVRLSVLQEMMRIWVVDYYHQKPHRTLGVPPASMWASCIRPEDILVPDDPARLDAILGRADGRVLSHRGIELDGLFYNSPELTGLRMRYGDRLDVEIRIDDSNIGEIIVLAPDKTRMFEVRCLSFEYADGLSRWQHQVCKRFAAHHIGASNPMSWLEAKEMIARIIDEEFAHKRRKSAKRLARYQSVEIAQLPKAPPSSTKQETEAFPRAEAPEQPPFPASEPKDPAEETSPPELPLKAKKRFAPVIRDRSPAMSEEFADDKQSRPAQGD
ncbi:Mu transposase C-terminal domain-containing protein [Paramagnetospirillum marisnigri]